MARNAAAAADDDDDDMMTQCKCLRCDQKLTTLHSRINVRANSFPVRVIALWNRLPEYVVMASRLTTFKRLLRTVNMSYAIVGKS